MVVKVKGIVISETPYSETSKILMVLTSTYGKIGVLSKGCRQVKSKLRGISQRLMYLELSINYREKGLSTLIDGSVINTFKNILNDISKMGYALYITDLVNQILREVNDKRLFDIYINSLLKINDGFSPLIISNIMELKLLDYLGVTPILDQCVYCGKKDDIITIDINMSGMICKKCYKEGYILDSKTIKLIRMLYYVDIEKIEKLEINDEKILNEIDLFIKEYYNKYTGMYFKSKDNLKRICN